MTEQITRQILNRFPSFWRKDESSNNYQVVKAFSKSIKSISLEVDRLNLQLYVNTASGSRLNDIGKIFKITRIPSESDESLRGRIKTYWNGFTGGGTIEAIESWKNFFVEAGFGEGDIEVEEIGTLKIRVLIRIDTFEQIQLNKAIRETIGKIKAAGVYPFFKWVISGNLVEENLLISDSVIIQKLIDNTWFIWDVSEIDGIKVFW